MILKIYIITVLISLAEYLIAQAAVQQKMKREYPKLRKSRIGTFEVLQDSLYIFIPVINILATLFLIFGFSKIYEEIINKKIEEEKQGL